MLLFISLSKRLPKVGIKECLWYRFTGSRDVRIENDEYESEIETGDVYGMVRKDQNFYVILKEDPEYVFPVEGPVMRSLLNRSKAYTGTVNGIKVSTKKSAVDKSPAVATGERNPTKATIYDVAPKRGEDKKLTQAVRNAKIPGAASITFMSVVNLPSGEQYTYYDASATYPDFDAKNKAQKHDKWEAALEKAVVASTKNMGLVVGCAIMKYEGKPVPTLVIVEDTLE